MAKPKFIVSCANLPEEVVAPLAASLVGLPIWGLELSLTQLVGSAPLIPKGLKVMVRAMVVDECRVYTQLFDRLWRVGANWVTLSIMASGSVLAAAIAEDYARRGSKTGAAVVKVLADVDNFELERLSGSAGLDSSLWHEAMLACRQGVAGIVTSQRCNRHSQEVYALRKAWTNGEKPVFVVRVPFGLTKLDHALIGRVATHVCLVMPQEPFEWASMSAIISCVEAIHEAVR